MHNIKNRAYSILASILSSSATLLSVAEDNFPAVPFYVSIGNEIIEVTHKNGLNFTIVRGRDGTTSSEHEVGSPVVQNLIAANITEIQEADRADLAHEHDYADINHDHNTTYSLEQHTHDTNQIQTDSMNRFVSETEKSTWHGKQDTLTFTPENAAYKGQPEGYASLDSSGRIPLNQIPDSARVQVYVVADETELNALTPQFAERAFRRDNQSYYIWDGTEWVLKSSTAEDITSIDWIQINGRPSSSPLQIDTAVANEHIHTNKEVLDGITAQDVSNWEAADSHTSNTNNPHADDKADVELSNVENYGIATQGEAEAGTINTKYMTPLRTKQAIDASILVYTVNTQSGDVTLTYSDVGAHPTISPKNTAYNKPFGVLTDTIARGDHGHAEYVHTVNTKYGDVTLTAAEVGAHPLIEPRYDAWNVDFGIANNQAAEGNHMHDHSVYMASVLDFKAERTEGTTDINITWKDPEDYMVGAFVVNQWKGTMIRKKIGSFPVDMNDGTLLVDSMVRDEHASTPVVDTGEDVYYMAFPYNMQDVVTVDRVNRAEVSIAPPAPPGGTTPTYEYDYGDYIETVEFGTLAVDTNNDGMFNNELDFPTRPWGSGQTGPTGAGNIYSLTGADGIDLGIGDAAGATNRITIKDTLAEGDPDKAAKTMKWLKFYKKHDLMGGIGQDHDAGRDLTGKADSFIYICDRTLVNRISWEDLDQGDWIYGKQITIDGINYICRAVTGGNLNADASWEGSLPATNEWDALMVKAHESGVPIWTRGTTEVGDAFGGGAWGQEIWSTSVSLRVRRGTYSPANVTNATATSRSGNFGWRPALVPVP